MRFHSELWLICFAHIYGTGHRSTCAAIPIRYEEGWVVLAIRRILDLYHCQIMLRWRPRELIYLLWNKLSSFSEIRQHRVSIAPKLELVELFHALTEWLEHEKSSIPQLCLLIIFLDPRRPRQVDLLCKIIGRVFLWLARWLLVFIILLHLLDILWCRHWGVYLERLLWCEASVGKVLLTLIRQRQRSLPFLPHHGQILFIRQTVHRAVLQWNWAAWIARLVHARDGCELT